MYYRTLPLMESSPQDDTNDTCLKAFVREVAAHAAQDTVDEAVDEPTVDA